MLILSQDIGNGNKTHTLNHNHSLAHSNGIWKNCETSPTQANSRCRWFININNKFRMGFQPPPPPPLPHTHRISVGDILFGPTFLPRFPFSFPAPPQLLPCTSPRVVVWSSPCGPPRVDLPVHPSPCGQPPSLRGHPNSPATFLPYSKAFISLPF